MPVVDKPVGAVQIRLVMKAPKSVNTSQTGGSWKSDQGRRKAARKAIGEAYIVAARDEGIALMDMPQQKEGELWRLVATWEAVSLPDMDNAHAALKPYIDACHIQVKRKNGATGKMEKVEGEGPIIIEDDPKHLTREIRLIKISSKKEEKLTFEFFKANTVPESGNGAEDIEDPTAAPVPKWMKPGAQISLIGNEVLPLYEVTLSKEKAITLSNKNNKASITVLVLARHDEGVKSTLAVCDFSKGALEFPIEAHERDASDIVGSVRDFGSMGLETKERALSMYRTWLEAGKPMCQSAAARSAALKSLGPANEMIKEARKARDEAEKAKKDASVWVKECERRLDDANKNLSELVDKAQGSPAWPWDED